jgi:hypothetical protein
MAEIPALRVIRKLVHRASFCAKPLTLLWALGLALGTLSLSGCGSGAVSAVTFSGSSGTSGSLVLNGRVHGGQQPVNGATISLYAAGKTGLASSPRSMLTGTVTSNSGGYFTITGKYACNSGDQVYIVATGGDAGSGANSAIAMMTALGPCATLLANASTTLIAINEVTTVASVYSLAAFMNSVQALGSDATNIPSTDTLAASFANTQTLVNTATGVAPLISTGNGIVPQSTIYALADALAACINSTASNSTACTKLFTAATVAASTPTDTLQAALNIAKNPAANPTGVYNVATTTGPFQPTLTSAPASWTITVAHPSDWLTYHGNNSRNGVQSAETVLTPANVTSTTFGKKFTFTVDSYLFAQPLYIGGIGMPDGLVHNLVVVASTHGTVYAFDADGSSTTALWSVSLLPTGERYPVAADYGNCGNPPEAAIVGTPVIDRAGQTIYLVSKTINSSSSVFTQRLHALSLIDGTERAGSPTVINPSFPGTGAGSSGGVIAFNAQRQLDRSALTLTSNSDGTKTVWVNFASHCDIANYHGIILGFDSSSLATKATFIDTPNGSDGGIWNGGGGLAADASGYIYALTGNGTFDVNTAGTDYGDAALKLAAPTAGSGSLAMAVHDYFVPSNQANLNSRDLDVGGAEAILFNDPASGVAPNLLIASDKNGSVYLIDQNNMQGYDTGAGATNGNLESFTAGGVFIYNFAFFNNVLYTSTPLKAYSFTPGTSTTAGSINQTPLAQPGVTQTAPVVSANGTTNGVVWAQDTSGVLHAYTTNLVEIYNTSQATGSRDAPATFVKFTSPVIANGKVYLSGSGSLVVYGPLP